MQTIYFNANIVTMDFKDSRAEAILIEDGIIQALGTFEELLCRAPEAKGRDMQGKTMLPAFIDAHSQIIGSTYAYLFGNAAPSPKGKCNTLEELITELKLQLKEKDSSLDADDWFIALGYDDVCDTKYKRLNKYDLDEITKERPMICIHQSGQSAVLNQKALDLCGISSEVLTNKDISLEKDMDSGELTGYLEQQDFEVIKNRMILPDLKLFYETLKKNLKAYIGSGIATAQESNASTLELEILRKLDKKKELPIDVVCYLEESILNQYLKKIKSHNNPYHKHVRFAGCKIVLDGLVEEYTAWLSHPYYLPPDGKDALYKGIHYYTDEQLLERMLECMKNNWQMMIHANGDAAVEQFLRCYEKCHELLEVEIWDDIRPILIHCQVIRKEQMIKIKEYGVCLSFMVDSCFVSGDMQYDSILGPVRAANILPIKSALKLGIHCTIQKEELNIGLDILGIIQHAMKRETKQGRILGKSEKISIYEALKAVTSEAAYQIFEEKQKGTLEEGKLADIIILNQNPLEVRIEDLPNMQVLETWKKGKIISEYI